MLRLVFCNDIDPFSWDGLRCPYCGGNEYTSINYATVVCDRCDCRFTVEAASEGCVVTATPPETGLFADRWECPCCDHEVTSITPTSPKCDNPDCQNHGGALLERSVIVDPKRMGLPDRFILILKETDCSGWIHMRESDGFPIRDDHPTTGQWTKFKKDAQAMVKVEKKTKGDSEIHDVSVRILHEPLHP